MCRISIICCDEFYIRLEPNFVKNQIKDVKNICGIYGIYSVFLLRKNMEDVDLSELVGAVETKLLQDLLLSSGVRLGRGLMVDGVAVVK